MLPYLSWVLQIEMYVRIRKLFVNRKLSKNPTILLQISSHKTQMFAKTRFESLKFEHRLITFYPQTCPDLPRFSKKHNQYVVIYNSSEN